MQVDHIEPAEQHRRAAALIRKRRFAEAARIYEVILETSPQDAVALINLGTFLVQQGEPVAGLVLLDRALAQGSTDPNAWNSHGSALKALGRQEEALLSFERAIGLKPDFASAHGNRGNLLRDIKRTEEALASYARAIELEPERATVRLHRASLLNNASTFIHHPASSLLSLSIYPFLTTAN